LNEFTLDFRFGDFDLDATESYYSDDGSMTDLEPLHTPLSYSSRYSGKAPEEARRVGCNRVSSVWLIFDFAYDPTVTGVTVRLFLRFLGAFPF